MHKVSLDLNQKVGAFLGLRSLRHSSPGVARNDASVLRFARAFSAFSRSPGAPALRTTCDS
jgi:hypothetical protein